LLVEEVEEVLRQTYLLAVAVERVVIAHRLEHQAVAHLLRIR
jgi:hypothetical protein